MAEQILPPLRTLLQELATGLHRWPLYLYGPAGVGKTYAACWLANQVPSSAYLLLDDLIQWAWDSAATLWRVLRDSLLVVVDEIGMRDADRAYLGLKRAADLRGCRPTIWISNLSPEELHRAYDDRILSRLCCGTVLRVEGPDKRFLYRG